jgi:hypothetical protein
LFAQAIHRPNGSIGTVYKAELDQLAQEFRFNPLDALKRKSEAEVRLLFPQRVQEDPVSLNSMLNIYAGWVEQMRTPQGLADFVLGSNGDEMAKAVKGPMEGTDEKGREVDAAAEENVRTPREETVLPRPKH